MRGNMRAKVNIAERLNNGKEAKQNEGLNFCRIHVSNYNEPLSPPSGL